MSSGGNVVGLPERGGRLGNGQHGGTRRFRAVRVGGPAGRVTRQYLAGELSLLLAQVQAVTTSAEARHEAWCLRCAAETQPLQRLGSITLCAMAFTERLCWESLGRGDAIAFERQSAVCGELHVFGVCAGLFEER